MWDVYYQGVITLCNSIAIIGGAIVLLYKGFKKAKEPTDNLGLRLSKVEESIKEYDDLNIRRSLHDLRHAQEELFKQQSGLCDRLDRIDEGIGLIIKYTYNDPENQGDIMDYLTKRTRS